MNRIAYFAAVAIAFAGCSTTNNPNAKPSVDQQVRQIRDACGEMHGYGNAAFSKCYQHGVEQLPGYIGTGNDAIAQVRGDRTVSKACATAPGVTPSFNC